MVLAGEFTEFWNCLFLLYAWNVTNNKQTKMGENFLDRDQTRTAEAISIMVLLEDFSYRGANLTKDTSSSIMQRTLPESGAGERMRRPA